MKELIEQLNHLAEVLYFETKGKYTVSRETAKTLQSILDDLQEELDKVANELYRPVLAPQELNGEVVL